MTQKLQLIANFLWYHICLSQTSHCNRNMWLVSKWLSMSLKMLMHALQAAATQMPCKMDTLVLRSLCTRTALCALRYCYCWSPALENIQYLRTKTAPLDDGRLPCLTHPLVTSFIMVFNVDFFLMILRAIRGS
jgi:hypothetical protein